MTESSRIVMSAAQVAEQLGGFVRGNPELQLTGFQPLHVAGESDLSFLHLTKYRAAALNSRAGAIIVNRGVELGERTLIVVCDASEAYRKAIDIFYPDVPMRAGVDPSAIIDGSATLGAGVQIGPRAIVGADVVVADGVSVMAGAIIGEACSIGRDSIIHYGAVEKLHGHPEAEDHQSLVLTSHAAHEHVFEQTHREAAIDSNVQQQAKPG
jgi:UDP-3-O-[3-hydroxymyristoyl] glucosamine N-acyltransferase